MTDITITGSRATTNRPADFRWLSIKRNLEGRTHLSKDGVLSFDASAHNLTIWKSTFPDCTVTDSSTVEKFFDTKCERPAFKFKTQPYPHQSKAFEKFKPLNTFAMFIEMGLGKSKLLTDLIAYKYCNSEIDAAIILSPKGVHFQWVEEQLPTHLGCDYVAWAWDKRKKALDVFHKTVENADTLRIVTMNIDAIRTKDGKQFLLDFIKKANGRVLLAVDEAHMLKEARAERTKVSFELSALCSHRAILTGSPIAKNIADLYSEFKFLDDRIIGTRYFSTFRSNYCELKPNYFGGFDIIGAKNLEKLYAKIDPYTFRATKDELDLPPKLYDIRQFEMADEQKRIYKEFKRTFLASIGDKEISVTTAAAALVKLQQISCGFLNDGEGNYSDLPNARLQTLLEIIEDRDDQIIIWCRFIKDIENISKALDNRCVTYYGDTKSDDREKAKAAFLSGEKQFFIGNPAAAGVGLNLQGKCTTAIYYSNDYNAVSRWQSEDRIHRIGTTGTCTYIDLVGRGTTDLKILANLRGKKSLSDMALDEVRKLFED